MGVLKWIQDRAGDTAKVLRGGCNQLQQDFNQVKTEIRSIPNKTKAWAAKKIENVSNGIESLKGRYFHPKNAKKKNQTPQPRKSIAKTAYGKKLTKKQIQDYDNYVANHSQGKQSNPSETRAFAKVQKLKQEKYSAKSAKKTYCQQQFEADKSINKNLEKQGEAQQNAYSGGMNVLNFVSFGGASQYEEARNDFEKGKFLSGSGRAVFGTALTAAGAYTTIEGGANLLYGGGKYLANLGRQAVAGTPSAAGAVYNTLKATVKNPRAVLKTVWSACSQAKSGAVKIINYASAGLKKIAETKLGQIGLSVSAAGSLFKILSNSKTVLPALRAASDGLIKTTGKLLNNFGKYPKTYLIKSGFAALGAKTGLDALADFKEGKPASGALRSLFALATPSVMRAVSPSNIIAQEMLSMRYSEELKTLGNRAVQKISGGLQKICDKTLGSPPVVVVLSGEHISNYEQEGELIFLYKQKLKGNNGDPHLIQLPKVGDCVLKRETRAIYPNGSTHTPVQEYIAYRIAKLLPRINSRRLVPETFLIKNNEDILLTNGLAFPQGTYSVQKVLPGVTLGSDYGTVNLTAIPPKYFSEAWYYKKLIGDSDIHTADNVLKISAGEESFCLPIDNAAGVNLKRMEEIPERMYTKTYEGGQLIYDREFLIKSKNYAAKVKESLTDAKIDELINGARVGLKRHPALRGMENYLDRMGELLKQNRDALPGLIQKAIDGAEGVYFDPFLSSMRTGDGTLDSFNWR